MVENIEESKDISKDTYSLENKIVKSLPDLFASNSIIMICGKNSILKAMKKVA